MSTLSAMLNALMLTWGLVFGQGAAQASGTFVGKAQLDEALKKAQAAPSGNIVDQKVSTTEIQGGKAHVAHLRRVRAETNALIHDHVTEIYYILEGSGTMMTGGRIEDVKESDLTEPRRWHEPHRHVTSAAHAEAGARRCLRRARRHGAPSEPVATALSATSSTGSNRSRARGAGRGRRVRILPAPPPSPAPTQASITGR